MSQSKIAPVKYTRDFYPDTMAVRTGIETVWREASRRAGFEEWDGPLLEHLDLYKRKSGEEIVGQLYHMTDRGDRELAVRPEMTPTLARMIVARQAALPKPLKWFCVARMCRYERGQRGRLREFWQWNADILGVDHPVADAEIVNLSLDALLAFGLTAGDVVAKINSRTLMTSLLAALGVAEDRWPQVFAAADRRGKVSGDALAAMYAEAGLTEAQSRAWMDATAAQSLDELAGAADTDDFRTALAELRQVFDLLAAFGKADCCEFDGGIVRGLAYYTGPVFEIFDRKGELRALCGGGRYDRLIETMGGQPMPACGVGMGDVALGELLAERGLLPTVPAAALFQVVADDSRLAEAAALSARLRREVGPADLLFPAGSFKKLARRAQERGVRFLVQLGADDPADRVQVRDLTGDWRGTLPIGFTAAELPQSS